MQLLLPYVSGHFGHRFDRTADSWNLLAPAGKHSPQLICIRYGEQQCMQLRPYIFQGRFVSKLCLSRNSWLAMLSQAGEKKKRSPAYLLASPQKSKDDNLPPPLNSLYDECNEGLLSSIFSLSHSLHNICLDLLLLLCFSLSLRLLSQYLLFFVCFYLALLTPF